MGSIVASHVGGVAQQSAQVQLALARHVAREQAKTLQTISARNGEEEGVEIARNRRVQAEQSTSGGARQGGTYRRLLLVTGGLRIGGPGKRGLFHLQQEPANGK